MNNKQFGLYQPPKREKYGITHRIGRCANCGWVNVPIRRVRVSEGKNAVIKALCVDCVKEQEVHVLCDLCGRTKCDNLYPVTVMRKRIGIETTYSAKKTCNLFLHLCSECRTISHEELLVRLPVPETICNTCKDRFVCFTEKDSFPISSYETSAVVNNKRTKIYKRYAPGSIRRGLFFDSLQAWKDYYGGK